MAIVGIRRISVISILSAIAVVASALGRAVEYALDRTIRFLFAGIEPTPAFAIQGSVASLDPQPGGHQISDQLWHRNRHEAHSHARAAHRGL